MQKFALILFIGTTLLTHAFAGEANPPSGEVAGPYAANAGDRIFLVQAHAIPRYLVPPFAGNAKRAKLIDAAWKKADEEAQNLNHGKCADVGGELVGSAIRLEAPGLEPEANVGVLYTQMCKLNSVR